MLLNALKLIMLQNEILKPIFHTFSSLLRPRKVKMRNVIYGVFISVFIPECLLILNTEKCFPNKTYKAFLESGRIKLKTKTWATLQNCSLTLIKLNL